MDGCVKQPQEILVIIKQVSDTGYCFVNHRARKHTPSAVDSTQQFTSPLKKFQPFGGVCLRLFIAAPVSVQPSLVSTEPCHRTLIREGIWASWCLSLMAPRSDERMRRGGGQARALRLGISHYQSPWTLQTVGAAVGSKSQRDCGRCGRDLTPSPVVLQHPLLPIPPNLPDTRLTNMPYILHEGGKSGRNTDDDLDKWRTDRFSLCVQPNFALGKLL